MIMKFRISYTGYLTMLVFFLENIFNRYWRLKKLMIFNSIDLLKIIQNSLSFEVSSCD